MDATGSYTAMGWVYLPDATSLSPWRTFFSFQGATNGFLVGTDSDKQTFMITDVSTNNFTGSLLPLTQWLHIAATYESHGSGSTTFRGYVNGKLDIDADNTTGQEDFNFFPAIGNYQQSYPLNGYVADVRVFMRVMHPDDIIKEMRSEIPVDKTNLYTWLPLESIATRDASGKAMVTITQTGTSVVRGPVFCKSARRKKFP
jgi:hypothetical protein